MLFPRSHAWTPLQKRLIAVAVIACVAAFSTLVYGYERYYRGPDDSFFVGTWRGRFEKSSAGNFFPGYRFKADHSFEDVSRLWEGTELSGTVGTWFAGGDFIYLRIRRDDVASEPYDTLEIWHIDSMSPTELHMHWDGVHVGLKRAE